MRANLPVYRGYSSQYGAGLGNVLGGVLRAAVPLLAPLVRTAGHRLLRAGMDTLETKLTGHKRKRTVPKRSVAPSGKRRKAGKRKKRDFLA